MIKKIIKKTGIAVAIALCMCMPVKAETAQVQPQAAVTQTNEELRGVWISYLNWNSLPKTESQMKAAVNQMLDNCKSWGMNAVFVHAHSHSDAMYPSDLLPWSKFASGKQGTNPGYDPFGYFVQAAHERGLKVHAWFNPYRVTGYLMPWSEVSANSPVKKWTTDTDPSNDRWVLKHNEEYYLNPSVPQVRQLVVDSVKEVLTKYDVDGIHFDDYFYPTINNEDSSKWFDKPEYDVSGSPMNISDWRRENVNKLISAVYRTVKEIRPSAEFGISPEGQMEYIKSDVRQFADIEKWVSNDGYVDYIAPQLYWGFEAKNSDGNLASWAFDNNLKNWVQLKKKGNKKMYLGLASYRAGTDVKDNNEISEWLSHNDILRRQVEAGRKTGNISGYCFYGYDSFLDSAAQAEIKNLLALFK